MKEGFGMKKWYKFSILTVILVFSLLLLSIQAFAATTVSFFDGQMTITDSIGNGSASASEYTATATGSLLSKKTNTITIKNETETYAKISFTYSVSNANSFTIAGAEASTSGNYSAKVGAGESIAIELQSKSGFGSPKATLTLTEITYTHMAASSDITFDFDSSLGTVTVGGELVNSGSTISVDESVIEIVATPVSGAEFVAWVYENNKFLSSDSTYTLKRDDMTVKALFSKDTPYFKVDTDTTHIFDDLNEAANEAEKNGSTVVLICDGVLPKGDYVIPQGVTLLIPFDDAHTLYTTVPGCIYAQGSGDEYVTPTAYRTLTMASGANITVNGAISLSAKHYAANGAKSNSGAPIGNVSFINMKNDSSITVLNGGKLYAWGYITGEGTVTAKSGSEVFEYFQFTDFRGGNQTTSMVSDNEDKGVFPLSQYYVQNVLVPLIVEYGAKETTYTSLRMGSSFLARTVSSSVNFFGAPNDTSEAMFELSSGYVLKKYDSSKDRLIVELNGDMSISPVSIKLETTPINSQEYELPINNISIIVKSGNTVSINQDISLLPRSAINIEEGATGILGEGVSAYVYDADEWSGYCSPSNLKFRALTFVPGRTYTRTDDDMVDAKVVVNGFFDASKGYVYTTQGGANVVSEGAGRVSMRQGKDKCTYQIIQATDPSDSQYPEISITTANLKNADDTYTEPAILEGCCATYVYSGRKWIPEKATNTEYSISDDNILINSSLILDVPSDTQIIIATYDLYERLLDAVCRTPESLEEVSLSGAGVAKIKVFAWDGFDIMSPISGVEEIPLNK